MTGITFCEKSIWSCKAASSSLHPYEQCASSEVHPCTRGTLYILVKKFTFRNNVHVTVFFGSIIEYPFVKNIFKNGIDKDENENDDDNDVLRNSADDINNHKKKQWLWTVIKREKIYIL